MAKYAIMMWILPRMEAAFTKKEIELASRVFFFMHPPEKCEILSAPEDLDITWPDDYLSDGHKVIRVVGEVEEP